MKYTALLMLFVAGTSAIHLQTLAHSHGKDEVDDLMDKADSKDDQVVKDKEENAANAKMADIPTVSRTHSSSADEDYLTSVFDSYATEGKNKKGESSGVDVLLKDKARDSARDILMKWNDLPAQNADKYLNEKFDAAWDKVDVNKHGFIDESEAYRFVRGLMGTFTSFIDGVDPKDLSLLALDN